MAHLPNITSVTIPESITAITSDTFTDCPQLATITVAPNNPTYASIDGLLYNKALTRILLCPESAEGVVPLPDQTDAVPASALSHCANLTTLLVGRDNAVYTSINGNLYSKDASTLIACPGGIGETLTLPKQTSTIGPDALAGITTLKSIVVLGNITTIDPTAFNDQTKQSTTIALPGGEDYETRKAVWQQAGFKNFATPANPGDTQTPDQPNNPTDPSKPTSGLSYKLLEDYTLEVSWTGELSPESTPSIPATAQLAGVSYTVSALAPGAFENQTALTAITLPSSLTSIGARAFAGTGLATLDIPASITTIGDQAFANCSNLTRIVTHTNTIQVAPTALEACTNLELWCPYNESETYPWTIGVFSANNHIKAYGLPASQQALTLEVGQSANLFEPGTLQAPEPAEVAYSYEATCLSVSPEGTITAKAVGTTTVAATLMLDDVALGKTQRDVVVSTPEASASNSRSDSEKAALPQASLVKMPLASQLTPAAVNDTIVQGHFTYTVLSVDAAKKTGTVSIKGTAPYASSDGLTIPRTITHGAAGETYTYTITEVVDAAFKDYANLAGTLMLPDSLVKIGSEAFALCGGLSGTLVIPDSLTTIGNSAFAYCRFSGHLIIPGSITRINGGIFNGLQITTVSIPVSVTFVTGAAFFNCEHVKSYTVAAGNQVYCSVDGIVYNKQMTQLVRYPSAKTEPYSIPSTVTSLGSEALSDFPLESIEIPSLVSVLEDYTFADSSLLQSVVLGAGVSGIPEGTFGWCPGLNSITVYGNVSEISQHTGTFFGVNKANTTIYLPTGIVGGRAQAARQETWRAEGFTLFADAPNKSITFDSQGGSAVVNQVVVPQTKANNPGDPSKKGYTFAGWYQNAACTGAPWDFNSSVTNSVTLYAKWVANTYSVAFNANGAAGSMNSQPFTYDAPAQALSANTFSKTGYTFAGWTEAQAGTGTRYADAQAVSNLSAQQGATVTLYAQWMPNTYTIAFNGNNATGGATAQLPMVYDVPANLTANGFTRTGYTFAGWNTAANGAGTSYAPGASVNNLTPTPGATVTLYAQWSLVISVDVPIEQSFSIDATGGITPTTTGASFFASSTVEPLRVSGIKCTKGAGADSIFKTPGDHGKIAITMAAGGPAASVPLVGDPWVQPGGANLFVIPAQTPGQTPVAGRLPVSFGLNVPAGVSYSYVNPATPDPFATLAFSVEALK